MQTTNPGQSTTLTKTGIPSGSTVGYQIQKAATGQTILARTTAGVVERPAGSGNYVITFTAPSSPDVYIVIWDWNGGVITPALSSVDTLQVIAQIGAGDTSLSTIADYLKMHLGGETYKSLIDSPKYGNTMVALAIDTVKNNVMANPPQTADEPGLSKVLLNYFGILAALQLIPAARDVWGSIPYSVSKGDSPTEMATYTNRANMMGDLQNDLLRRLAEVQAPALALVAVPIDTASNGPLMDEDGTGARVTDDPRCFPTEQNFPYDVADYPYGGYFR